MDNNIDIEFNSILGELEQYYSLKKPLRNKQEAHLRLTQWLKRNRSKKGTEIRFEFDKRSNWFCLLIS